MRDIFIFSFEINNWIGFIIMIVLLGVYVGYGSVL